AAVAADIKGILLRVLLAEEGALDDERGAAAAIEAAGDDDLAAGVDRGLAARDEDVLRRRAADETDTLDLPALLPMRLGRGGQVGVAEAVEDTAAAPRQGLEQFEVLGTESRAVAVEARAERA